MEGSPVSAPGSAEDLALSARRGSVPAFEALVLRYQGPLYNFLRVRSGSAEEAEELSQEAFLRAWLNLERYDARWRFSTWLFTLARRLAVSARRSSGREPPRETAGDPLGELACGRNPAAEAQARDEGRALWLLAERVLRVEERSALWLRYGEELSVQEIARILGRPQVSVRVLLFRARGRLAGALAGEGTGGACAGAKEHVSLARDGVGGMP